MPIDDFSCPVCGHRFEAIVPMNAEEAPCRASGCGGVAKRQFSFGRHVGSVDGVNHHSVAVHFNYVD